MLSLMAAAVVLVLVGQTPGGPDEAGGGRIPVELPAEQQISQESSASANEMAGWLVHLARHRGHLAGRTDPRRASLHVLALLGAATEVSPDCAKAYYWLYDLEQRLGREDEARAALSHYVRLTPGDDAARIRHLELALTQRQTAQGRADYVRSELTHQPLSGAYESELRRWLGTYYFERRESEAAAREVEHALRLNAMNVAARELAYEVFGETEPALQRVETALQLIAMNPSQANLVWDLAEFLDGLSLHSPAQEWYQRAIDVHRLSGSGPIPAGFWHKLALSYSSSGDYEKAKMAADQALKVDASFHAGRLLRSNAETELGLLEAAAEDLEFVSQAYSSRVEAVIGNRLAEEAAEVAWFYCYHRPDQEKATALAEIAMTAADPSPLARLASGYALRLQGRTDQAVPILESLASTNQLAALELAKARIEQGDQAQAMTILHKAATVRYSGRTYNMIRDLLAEHGESAAQAPPHGKIVAALDKFQKDVFDYAKRPEDYLRFTIRFADKPLPPIGPMKVVFRLENIGPFTIPLGEGFMCRPLIAVSTRVIGPQREKGERDVGHENYLQFLMNSRLLLSSGEAVEKTVAIDVGPIREHLTRTATQTVDLEVTAKLDPVSVAGELTSGLGTITGGPIRAARPGLDVSVKGISGLLNKAHSANAADRILVAERLGALLADAEHCLPNTQAEGLPIEALQTALAVLLSDHDWQVRARAMVAAGWSPLDSRVTNAAASAIRDQNSVVKLLAVRLFAEQHGESFVQVLELLSKTDPNRFVRLMAESYCPGKPRVQANQAAGRTEAELP